PCQVRNQQASSEICEQLQEQHSTVMLHAEDRENGSQECWISRKSYPSGDRALRSAHGVYSVLQPVLGDIPVDERICGDSREAEDENQAQQHCCNRRHQKEPWVLAYQLTHAWNITFFSGNTSNVRFLSPNV